MKRKPRIQWSREDIPFELGKSADASLTQQMTDGVRAAIVSGRFKAGTILPTILEWTALLGCSKRVPEGAIAILAREGWIVPKQQVGCIVAPKRQNVWGGRVLAVVPDGDHVYYQNVLVGRLRSRVAEGGYLFTQTTVLRNSKGNYDTRQLKHELASKPGFALLIENRPELERLLSRSGVPFGVFGERLCTLPGCVANFRKDTSAAVAALAKDCVRAGVRRVVQATKATGGTFDAAPALRAAGIEVEEFTTPVPHEYGRTEGTVRGALDAFRRRFAEEGRGWLPELLVFSGDHVASGALIAMMEAGVNIPGDVRVVSLANTGLGPVFPVPLARIENNPYAHGDILADAVCAFLAGKSLRGGRREMAARYFPGPSFPESVSFGERR